MSETVNKYEIRDGVLVGPGLRFEAAALVEPERQSDPKEGKLIILDAIVDLLNGAYLQGCATVRLSVEDREALVEAAALLQGRHKRAILVIQRLLAPAGGPHAL